MRFNRRRIERQDIERVLDALEGDPRTDPDPLIRLLAAARAPAHESELAGEEAAVAAFREAMRPAPGPAPPRATRRGFPPARLFTLKATAVAVAVTAVGGVALASGTGALPGPGGAGDRSATRSPASPAPSTESGSRPSGVPSATPLPGKAAVGLCRAYSTTARSDPGRARRGAAFAALARQAGGEDKVTAFCARVLAADKARHDGRGRGSGNEPRAEHSPPGHPSGSPAVKPDPGKSGRTDPPASGRAR